MWLGGVWRGPVTIVIAAAVVACGLGQQGRPFDDEDDAPFSAAHLDDPIEESPAFEVLTPAEREALKRSEMPPVHLADEENAEPAAGAPEKARAPLEKDEGAFDKAGKVGLSVLTVGLSIAAAAAPFFLF